MCIIVGAIITTLLFISPIWSFVHLYNTEDGTNVEAFDCVYYKERLQPYAVIPFCRREDRPVEINRKTETCALGSEKHRFSDLRQRNISVREILRWSSSIEVADRYAAFLIDNVGQDDGIICECNTPTVFGKFCEYELYGRTTIDETFQEQLRYRDKWSIREKEHVYGHTLCYTRLQCDSGLLCLDYRDICDGHQQCTDGLDEENCDKLEFNECDDDEYRCLNGMCIPEQYFLDGDWDCMDHTDEQMKFIIACYRNSSISNCDEHLCSQRQFSCGDGQCIPRFFRTPFQQVEVGPQRCNSMREYLYQCELQRILSTWTSKSGQCLLLTIYNLTLNEDTDFYSWSNERKCSWLVRCALVRIKTPWCPCFGNGCATNISSTCQQSLIMYPNGRLLNALTYVAYKRDRTDWLNRTPEVFFISGSIKCRGFHVTFKKDEVGPIIMTDRYIELFQYDSYWCNFNRSLQHRNTTLLAPHFNLNCVERDASTFNGKSYKFDDVCETSRECISNHRLLDGSDNCYDKLDEQMSTKIEPECLSNKHRFRCSTEQPSCYLVGKLYNVNPACANYHDIYLYGTESAMVTLPCTTGHQANCKTLRNYIRNHETGIRSKSVIPYVYYCDTFWDTISKADESSTNCQQWVCMPNEYQCATGQCILNSSVCDGTWHCSDASDEHGLFAIDRFSDHNERFFNLTVLHAKCTSRYPEHQQPFHTKCNRSVEYPCLLADVLDPTDIHTNRPCIPLLKIGDNATDCYGGLDERNVQASCLNHKVIQHFDFLCPGSKISECIRYNELCKKRCSGDEPLCFYRRGLSNGSCSNVGDFLCLNGTCIANARCNSRTECSHGEDEYWCNYDLLNSDIGARIMQDYLRSVFEKSIPSLAISRQLPLETIDDKAAFACNRGIAIRKLDHFVCLCPPTYYGLNCEFYSDRLNFIIQLNEIRTATVCFVALLFFNNQIIDEFDFHIEPSALPRKYRFHLIYSRSDVHLNYTRDRYSNRNQIIHYHPYTVRFEAYELKQNNSVRLEAVWSYPIYFDFLPSFRFSKILRFESSNNACLSHSCSINSICYPILNENTSFICQCKSDFYGENCDLISDIYTLQCAPNAICKPTYQGIIKSADHPLCICPINRFGPTCHLDYNECYLQPCANNGSCLSRYDRTGLKSYECQCTEPFYGDQCQDQKRLTELHLLHSTYSAVKFFIEYYDLYTGTYKLVRQIQQVYSSTPISFQFYNEKVDHLSIALLKLYEKYDKEPLYFILSVQRNRTSINKTSLLEYPCPIANSFLMVKENAHIPNAFKYHHLCRASNASFVPKCFYDNEYLCICSADSYRAECFIVPSDNCSKCLSNGRCVEDVTENVAKEAGFICICPRCHYGHRCESSTLAFSFTLDSLIVGDVFGIRFIYLSIALILFFIGLVNNICSYCTFKRGNSRKVGTGTYFFIVSILSQLSLTILLLKIIHILISSNNLLDNAELLNIFMCRSISYLLPVTTRSAQWLLSWITLERLSIVLYPTATLLKKPKLAIYLSMITIVVIFAMHIHATLYYTVVKDSNNTTICVVNFTEHVLLYDRVTVLFHSLGPFIIQICSITALIVLLARNRRKLIKSRNTNVSTNVLREQFKQQKELYMSPAVVILSALPQIILSFSLACTEASTAWKRYLILTTYFISYFPQMLSLFLHVKPSTLYTNEFHETFIYKIFVRLTGR